MVSSDGSRLLYTVIGISFLSIMAPALTGALRPLFIVEVGADLVQLALIMALPSFVSLLTRVPASAFSGRIGRWRMMVISLVLSALTTVAFAFVRDPAQFYPVVAIAALSWAIFSPITVEFVSSRATAETQGSMMGFYFTSIAAPMFLGPFLSSFLTLYLDLRTLFLVSAVFPAVALGAILFMVKPNDLVISGPGDEGEAERPAFWRSIIRILRVRNFAVLCLSRVSFAMSMGIFNTAYPVFAESTLGLTPSLISLLFTSRGVTNVLTRMPAGRLSDRIGRRKPFIAAYLLVIVSFVLLSYFRRFEILLVALALYGVGWGVRIAPSMALAIESVSDEDRPIALAVFMTMFDVGNIVGSLATGFTSSFLPTNVLMLICAPIMLVSIIIFTVFSKEVEP
jgi:MFS family permease